MSYFTSSKGYLNRISMTRCSYTRPSILSYSCISIMVGGKSRPSRSMTVGRNDRSKEFIGSFKPQNDMHLQCSLTPAMFTIPVQYA